MVNGPHKCERRPILPHWVDLTALTLTPLEFSLGLHVFAPEKHA